MAEVLVASEATVVDVGILDGGYTKDGPLPRINPIRRVTVCLGSRNKYFFCFHCLLLLIGQARRYG